MNRHAGWALSVLVLAGGPSTLALPASAASTAVEPSFAVAVSLSPRAAARLAHPKETIIVSADIYGDGNGKARRQQDEMGQIHFPGGRTVELGGPGVAQFPGAKYNPALLADVDANGMQVLINVYSGRRSSPGNLLDCDLFQDKITIAARAPIQIHCKLIEE